MRTRLTALFLVVFALASSLTSQTADDPNEGLIFTHDASDGHFTLSWWGHSGKTYYVQHSSDLIAWEWVLDASAVTSGADDILQMSLQTNAKSGFFRLVITDNNALPATWLASYGLTPGSVGSGPNDDSDGDGLTNFEEFLLGTDPTKADTDGDGFSDKDEQTSGSDPNSANSRPPEVTGDIVLQSRWVEVNIGKTFHLIESWGWEQTENGWSNVKLFTRWEEENASETGTWVGSDGQEHNGGREQALAALATVSQQPWVDNSSEVEIRGQSNSGLTPVDPGYVGTETYRQSMPSTAPDGNTDGIVSVEIVVNGGEDVIRVEEVRLHRKAPASTSVNVLKPEASKTLVVSHEVNGIVGSVEAKTLSLAEGEDDGNDTQLLAPTLEAKKAKKDVASNVGVQVSRPKVNGGAWMSQNGSLKDLLSVWADKPTDDTIKFKLILSDAITGSLPANFIHWEVQDSQIQVPPNSLETPDITWTGQSQTYGVKTVTAYLGDSGAKVQVHVDVPFVGELNELALAAIYHFTTQGDIQLLLMQSYSEEAASWAISKTQPEADKHQDALRHSAWTSLSASNWLLDPQFVLNMSTAHEKSGKSTSAAHSSTMDLHNNLVGIYIGLTTPNTREQILAAVLSNYKSGKLWTWVGDDFEILGTIPRITKRLGERDYENYRQTGLFGATQRSDDRPINFSP